MKLLAKHMASIARLVLVVTIAASSGLMTVVHNCTMSKMDCCSHSPGGGHNNCDLPGVPLSGPSISAAFTCHTNTVVGGVTIKPAEVEKEQKSKLTRIAVATITTSLNSCLGHTSGSSHALFSLAVAISPPSVEKCVLDASLLI